VAVSQRIGYHGEQEMAMNRSAKPARAESPGIPHLMRINLIIVRQDDKKGEMQ
jgi:hypothetical protein